MTTNDVAIYSDDRIVNRAAKCYAAMLLKAGESEPRRKVHAALEGTRQKAEREEDGAATTTYEREARIIHSKERRLRRRLRKACGKQGDESKADEDKGRRPSGMGQQQRPEHAQYARVYDANGTRLIQSYADYLMYDKSRLKPPPRRKRGAALKAAKAAQEEE